MSCTQQQSPTHLHAGIPALRINTDLSSLRKAPFEEINSAPVTKKELGFQDVVQHQYSPTSVAFASNNWRSTMAVPSCPPGTSSSTEDPSPERIFSNEDAFINTSESSEHRISPINQGHGSITTQGRSGSVSSPLISEVSSGSSSGGSLGTSPAVREAALARIISHGYSNIKSLGQRSPNSMDRVDIFEVLPAALNAEGRPICQNHTENGLCDCEAFPLVKINFPLPASRSNRVCYPIQEVDESQVEPQTILDAELTPKVTPKVAAKAKEDGKRQLEAERWKGLLGKLHKPSEDRCSKIIKEWKGAVNGPSERLDARNKETYRKTHGPGHGGSPMAGEQSVSPGSTDTVHPEREGAKAGKPSTTGLKIEITDAKLQASWNPKAKEFSPSKVRAAPGNLGPAGQAAGAKARELLAKFVSQAKSREAGRGNEKKTVPPARSATSPSPSVSRTANVQQNSFTPHFELGPPFAQVFPGISPLGLPALTMPNMHLGGLSSPGLGTAKFDYNPLSGIGALNQASGAAMAGAAGLISPSLASLTGANLGPQRLFTQTFPSAVNAMAPAPTRVPPGPVPKPRLPDALAQQQYEQWIEWRKANEPGYALECKARQARRAQRTKPTSGSSLQSESHGATNGVPATESRSGDSKTE